MTMRRSTRVLVALSFVACAARAHACLWDRDTLEQEATGLPDVLRVITGRFERNPSLFYEMRLKRVSEEIKTNPASLTLYDDVAVACDRLGRDDEAIAWMGRKKKVLGSRTSRDEPDHWYRLHANLGTFLARKWFRSAPNHRNAVLLDRSIRELKAALEIDPEAHFGRERYQLQIIEEVGRGPGSEQSSLGERLLKSIGDRDMAERTVGDSRDKLVTGLSGLVVLGNAWESPDVYEALSSALSSQRLGVLGYLAALRYQELVDRGRPSVFVTDPSGVFAELEQRAMVPKETRGTLRNQFAMLRREADLNNSRRQAYMLKRLKQGHHPDTDASFWSEWRDPGPPSLRLPLTGRFRRWISTPAGVGTVLATGVTALAVVVGSVVWLLRRRHTRHLAGPT